MSISDILIHRYRIPLTTPLTLKDLSIEDREGFVITLMDAAGNRSFGEVAPLPAFSRESLARAESDLKLVKHRLAGVELDDKIAQLDGTFQSLLSPSSLCPSVRFGVETAMLGLVAASTNCSLASLLGAGDVSHIKVNALLRGSADEIPVKAADAVARGFTSLKIKIGGLTLDDAVKLVRSVSATVGKGIALRVDANRSFALGDGITLIDKLGDLGVEYVEEPVRNLGQLRKLLSEKEPATPVALDESLFEIKPEDLALPYPVKAVVIKPTLLGFEQAYRFAVSAKENDITPVISSSFESSLGISALAAVAAAVGGTQTAAGLDTLVWLKEDIVENPAVIENGRLSLTECNPDKMILRMDMLQEVVGD